MKITLIKIILVVLVSCIMTNCFKEVSEDLPHDVQIVVSGSISNEVTPIEVTIQETIPVRSASTFSPVNTAKVVLYEKDREENISILTDAFTVVNGTYRSTTRITTTTGHRYWIEVTLSDGTILQSEAEELLPVVPILNLEIEDKEFVTARFNDPENRSNFYRVSLNLWNEGELVHTETIQSNDVLFDGKENTFVELYKLKTNEEDEDAEDMEVVHDTVEVLFSNINLGSFAFFEKLSIEEEVIKDQGDPFFSPPPANLFGNIRNKTTGKKVLGNFTVNAISRLRESVQ